VSSEASRFLADCTCAGSASVSTPPDS
jgi:hypothetical protein